MKRIESNALRNVVRMLALVLVGMAALFSATKANAQSEESSSPNGLEGTWRVTVQLHVCGTATNVGGPFQSLLTFGRGGTLVEDTANSMFYPAFRSPGHGIWKAQNGAYSASSMAFITSNGALVMTQRIDQTIMMADDPNHFTVTNAKVRFFDPSGNSLKEGCANAVGLRYQ